MTTTRSPEISFALFPNRPQSREQARTISAAARSTKFFIVSNSIARCHTTKSRSNKTSAIYALVQQRHGPFCLKDKSRLKLEHSRRIYIRKSRNGYCCRARCDELPKVRVRGSTVSIDRLSTAEHVSVIEHVESL